MFEDRNFAGMSQAAFDNKYKLEYTYFGKYVLFNTYLVCKMSTRANVRRASVYAQMSNAKFQHTAMLKLFGIDSHYCTLQRPEQSFNYFLHLYRVHCI